MDLVRTFGTPTMPVAGGGSVANPYYYGRQSPAGFTEAIAGWNFVDGNNNPYDSVHYDHGTGEAQDSTGAANTISDEVGACPNCMILPIRVGDSFVTSANQFARGRAVRHRLGRERDPGSTWDLRRHGDRAGGRRLRERTRGPRHRERSRRGGPAPQSSLCPLAHDRRQLGDAGHFVQPAELSVPERLYQLRGEHLGLGGELLVLFGGDGQGLGNRRPARVRGRGRDGRGQARSVPGPPEHRRPARPALGQRGQPAGDDGRIVGRLRYGRAPQRARRTITQSPRRMSRWPRRPGTRATRASTNTSGTAGSTQPTSCSGSAKGTSPRKPRSTRPRGSASTTPTRR